MKTKPDRDGRYDLTGREWNAIRCLQVAMNEVDVTFPALWERLKLIPYGRRDIKMVLSRLSKMLDDLYTTIPAKKLLAMKTEIQHSQIRLCVRGADNSMPPGVVYIDEAAFIRLMDRMISQECWCCEKVGKEVKRCEILKCIEDVLHYSSDPDSCPVDGRCELAGCTSVLKEE